MYSIMGNRKTIMYHPLPIFGVAFRWPSMNRPQPSYWKQETKINFFNKNIFSSKNIIITVFFLSQLKKFQYESWCLFILGHQVKGWHAKNFIGAFFISDTFADEAVVAVHTLNKVLFYIRII